MHDHNEPTTRKTWHNKAKDVWKDVIKAEITVFQHMKCKNVISKVKEVKTLHKKSILKQK